MWILRSNIKFQLIIHIESSKFLHKSVQLSSQLWLPCASQEPCSSWCSSPAVLEQKPSAELTCFSIFVMLAGSVLVPKNVNFKPNWLAMKALDYTIVYFISTEFFSVQSGQWAKTAKAGLTPLQSGERAHKAPCVMLTQAINYFLDKNNLRNCFGFSWSKDIECVVLGTLYFAFHQVQLFFCLMASITREQERFHISHYFLAHSESSLNLSSGIILPAS